jgi:hypothetical protein
MNTNLELIRQKCIAANPEIEETGEAEEDGEIVYYDKTQIGLADVSLAIGKTKYREAM